MAIMLNSRPKVYENTFFSVSQPSDSSTILQIAGIAGGDIMTGIEPILRGEGTCPALERGVGVRFA